MINYSVLPHTTITGRVANKLQLQHSKKRHTPYLIVILYLQDGHTAHLVPVIAFNYRAEKLYHHAIQSDLLTVQANIEFHYYKGYLNPSLVVSNWSFREAKAIRQIIHQQPLHKVFPFVPNNYPPYLRKKVQAKQERAFKQSASASVESSASSSATAKVSAIAKPTSEEKQNKVQSKLNDKKDEKESNTADWLNELNQVTKFAFPSMN